MDLPVPYATLAPEQRRAVREEYIRRQGGKCHHCGEPLTEQASQEVLSAHIVRSCFPENFFKWPVHLHHSHDTGLTIGAVHARCNAYLWLYKGE